MGLTPFGKAVRKLRVEKDLRLFDLARLISRSTAFLSAVETGRKPIPDGFVVEIARALDLSAKEIRELDASKNKTRKEVRVEKLSADNRELVAVLARRLDLNEIPEATIQELRKKILKSADGENPFYRKRRGFLVPPISFNRLHSFADKIRSIFVEDDRIDFPIIEVLEHKLGRILPDFYLDVQGRDLMGEDEGRVYNGRDELILRQDVYDGACNGDRRARFTACHEFAHYLMHRTIPLSRARDDTDKIYCDSEWQADRFAGALLMSPRHVQQFDCPLQAAEACKINPAAAKFMWGKYTEAGIIMPQRALPEFDQSVSAASKMPPNSYGA
jgi:transcriptional regulator with XRE-family HTH domain